MESKLWGTLAFLAAAAAAASAEPIYVTTIDNRLLAFDSASPATITSSVDLTGLDFPENLAGIDFRPANGVLYGLGGHGRLYTINPSSGHATEVGAGPLALSGQRFGMDFNPVADRLRVVSDLGGNLRIDPATGTIAGTDANLAYASGDANSGRNPALSAVAYSNNVAGAATTTLFGIDPTLGILVKIDPPNSGVLQTVGPLGITPAGASAALDISGETGQAYAVLDTGGGPSLFAVNLATGAATLVGAIGGSPGVVNGMSAALSVGPCGAVSSTLCLNKKRFKVTAEWKTQAGQSGQGSAVELTEDTGYFWFFADTNVEVIVKILNACDPPFNTYWVFLAGLTNVDVTIRVTDTATGAEKTYHNPQGQNFAPIFDTAAFNTCP